MEHPHTRFDQGLRIALVVLLALLVALCGLLVWQLSSVRQSIPAGRPHFSMMHGVSPATDPNVVQSWMTFDYVGHIFRLQPDYLKTALGITDSRYPRLTIAEAAEAGNISVAAYLASVRAAISQELKNPGT